MPVVRKTQVENLAQMSGEELERFLESLPATQDEIEDLFDYLEERLERSDCNHSLRYAMQYMMENRLNFPKGERLAQLKRRLLRLRGPAAYRP